MSQHEEQQSAHQQSDTVDGAVLLKSEAERLQDKERERQGREDKQRNLQLVFNGLLVLTSIATAVAVTYQGWIMRRSLEQLTKQATAGSESAKAAAKAAGIADATLAASVEQFRLSERPYLVIGNVRFSEPPKADKETTLIVTASNSGKTPGLHINPTSSPFLNASKMAKLPPRILSESTVGSGASVEMNYLVQFDAVTLKRITDEKLVFSMTGVIQYQDIFKATHKTRYCVLYDAKANIFKFCRSGNEIE